MSGSGLAHWVSITSNAQPQTSTPWVLHLTFPLWIPPLRYLEYAGAAKARFRPSTLYPSILSSPSVVQ